MLRDDLERLDAALADLRRALWEPFRPLIEWLNAWAIREQQRQEERALFSRRFRWALSAVGLVWCVLLATSGEAAGAICVGGSAAFVAVTLLR